MSKKYALISVFDKMGIVEFARTISSLGFEIISTGGTAQILQENKIMVIPVQKITGNPECFDGRMKTISFQIESGILYDRSIPTHVAQAKKLGIIPINLVVCNLYPFEAKQTIENIDVGGPTMIRAAGKNFNHVLVVTDPADYSKIGKLLEGKNISFSTKKELAAKAFAHLSFYDAQVAKFLNRELFPQELTIPGRKIQELRYGENPHQKAAFYLEPNTKSPFKNLKCLFGRKLSLLNLTDINAGLEAVKFFTEPAAAVIKHNSPCGIGLGKNITQALSRAIDADPTSAFGGIIVTNKKIDISATKIVANFKKQGKGNFDIIAAPFIDKKALGALKKIRKSMGIYTFGSLKKQSDFNFKWINGGFIMQEEDGNMEKSFLNWKVVTKKKPTKKQLQQMQIAWKFISRIRSNTIIVMDPKLPMTRGIGSGQTSRIRAAQIALEQAGHFSKNSVLASDSFFPFADTVNLAAKNKISAIVQQGGSINDQASIDAADRAGLIMIFTNRRAFWH